MNSNINRNRVLLLHLSFWCVYLSFFVYQLSSYQRGRELDWGRVFTIAFIQVSFAALISYVNYFYLLPRFLSRRKIFPYIIQFLALFGAVITVRLFTERFILDGFTHQEGYLYRTRFVVQMVTSNFFIVVFVGMLRFAQDWFELEARRKEVEREKLLAELNFLKAQINPHFLFNTLNNLYYLAYSKSDRATEVIDKLSKMMRYMIYESNHPQVLLSKEIEYMQNYISLERIRLSNEVPIDYTVVGDVQGAMIAPLIFITFLENAFKHGVTGHAKGPWVKISITMEGKTCIYTVANSKAVAVKEVEKLGIGLVNVKRRLELSYPQHYELTIQDGEDRFEVQLKLDLS